MSISKSLKTNYKKYQKGKNGQKETLGFLHTFMQEMIFRTTKLEGESVTRKMVKSIFG